MSRVRFTNLFLSAFLTVGLIGAFSVPVLAAEALPLKRVMLSTGGVGYFEHEAIVDGDGELALEVRLDQVDDVLKSIVIYDDTGGVGTISLPGRQPLRQAFKDFPFNQGALASPAALLNALQGARIKTTGGRAVEGRIIRVVPETVKLGDGLGTIVRHRVSLLTNQGVQQLVLEDIESFRFSDPGLQAQVEDALDAIARHRVRDKRTLRISVSGDKKRVVRVAYVVSVPLWKSTYRLTLPGDGDGSGRGHLQGWAVLENASGRDWRGVELTVVSGNPVTFRQAIYASYYVNRPNVPVEVLGRILPDPDRGTVAFANKVVGGAGGRREHDLKRKAEMEKRLRSGKKFKDMAKSSMGLAPAPQSREALAETSADSFRAANKTPEMAATALLAQSSEAATQVLFRVTKPVSVANGHSLVVPIVNAEIPAERLALYQPATHATHPLASVRLKNDGKSGLPPGVLTIYERTAGAVAFVGDARLTTLPAGDERLVSFALDQKTRIDRTVENDRRLAEGTINRGVFKRTIVHKQTTTYRLKGPAREARTVILEHPRRPGWELVTPGKVDVELTDKAYRIPVALKAGGEDEIKVEMEWPRIESVHISTLSLDNLTVYSRTGTLSAPVRQAFARMADMRGEIAEHRRRLKALEKERAEVFNDQRRVRDNLNRIPRGGDLARRYLRKMNSQETFLEKLAVDMDDTRELLKKAEDALAAYVATLEL